MKSIGCLKEPKMTETGKKSPMAVIVLAWLLVGIPLGWGIYNTLLSSMNLFRAAK
jgi:hypothetical protein